MKGDFFSERSRKLPSHKQAALEPRDAEVVVACVVRKANEESRARQSAQRQLIQAIKAATAPGA